jgi:hypothetical protein
LLWHETLDLLISTWHQDYHTANKELVTTELLATSKDCNHITSAVALATDLYLASVFDLETAAYFLALQEIRFGPKNRANPPVDRRSSTQPAQSVFEKALTKVELDFINVSPTVIV